MMRNFHPQDGSMDNARKKGITFTPPKELPDTVAACHDLIHYLFQVIQQLQAQQEEQALAVQKQALEIQTLRTQLSLNSRNSSKPPSSDGHKKRKPKKTRASSGKSSGGQPGHAGHHRALLPVSEVDDVMFCDVASPCERCGGKVRTTRGLSTSSSSRTATDSQGRYYAHNS